jgi:hypothetical protein
LRGWGDAAEPGEGGFGVQSVGVVAGGDEELSCGVDADAGECDEVGGHGGDEGGQVAVEVVDLGLKSEPAASEAAQGDLGGGGWIADRAGSEGGARRRKASSAEHGTPKISDNAL